MPRKQWTQTLPWLLPAADCGGSAPKGCGCGFLEPRVDAAGEMDDVVLSPLASPRYPHHHPLPLGPLHAEISTLKDCKFPPWLPPCPADSSVVGPAYPLPRINPIIRHAITHHHHLFAALRVRARTCARARFRGPGNKTKPPPGGLDSYPLMLWEKSLGIPCPRP
eukprot:COSAG02_NODE_63_length_43286_cov_54.666412_21_plen_165_part_00